MCYVENTTLDDIAYFICLLYATAVKYFLPYVFKSLKNISQLLVNNDNMEILNWINA